MDTLLQDVRFALRTLSRARGFTVAVVLVLALGIGANTAMFSVVDAVFLRPLPYRAPERLMLIHTAGHTAGYRMRLSVPDFHFIREHASAFEDFAGVGHTWFTVFEGGSSELTLGARVTIEYFRVFDGQPWLGRTFARGDTEDDHLAVLSFRLWKERFGGNPDIVGQLVHLDTKPYRVIGVMPQNYQSEFLHELWVLSDLQPDDKRFGGLAGVQPAGRLRPGTSIAVANQEIAAIGARLAGEHPSTEWARSYAVTPLHEVLVKDSRRNVVMMLGAIVLVLLIACTNVANLLLARGSARGAEIGIRLSLGATRARIVRQLLTEGTLLALAGGALGLLLAAWTIDILVAGFTSAIPHAERAGLDARALGFTVAISLVTTLLFGLAPALQASRGDLHAALKEGGLRATATKRALLLRGALVVSQIALAVVLVAGAGVLARSLARLASVERGFDTTGVAVFGLRLPEERYPTPERRAAFFEAALAKLKATPGVEAAGAVWNLPTIGFTTHRLEIEGRLPYRGDSSVAVRTNAATPDYAKAIGMPIREGRFIEDTDVLGATPVVVINKSMADRFFPGERPIGHRIRVAWDDAADAKPIWTMGLRVASSTPSAPNPIWYEIVGVVEDVRCESLRKPPISETFRSLAQHPGDGSQFAVRLSVPPSSALPLLRSAFREVDPHVPIRPIQFGRDLKGTLESFVTREVEPLRFAASLAAVLGIIALVLAAMGVFGVVSYSVEQRRHELGLRLALGALPRHIVRLVLQQSALLVTVGVIVGLGAALFAMRLLSALVFDVSPLDPPSLAIAALVLVATALVASYIPARRATRIAPMTALREL